MSRTHRLLVVLILNLVLVVGLVTVGVTAHSLAVLAAGGDYLLDAAGVALALLAIRISARAASRRQRTNASNLAALVNAGWLLILETLVAIAAVDRLTNRSPQVHGLPVLIVSAIAALVMATGGLVLREDGDNEKEQRDPSVAAVLLDTVADAAAAAGVAATGAVILATGGWYWLDPAVALTIAVVVAYYAVALIRKVLSRLRTAATDRAGLSPVSAQAPQPTGRKLRRSDPCSWAPTRSRSFPLALGVQSATRRGGRRCGAGRRRGLGKLPGQPE